MKDIYVVVVLAHGRISPDMTIVTFSFEEAYRIQKFITRIARDDVYASLRTSPAVDPSDEEIIARLKELEYLKTQDRPTPAAPDA